MTNFSKKSEEKVAETLKDIMEYNKMLSSDNVNSENIFNKLLIIKNELENSYRIWLEEAQKPIKIFIICSVREATEDYNNKLEEYVKELENMGYIVHLPKRDTNQYNSGLNICKQNKRAIQEADEIHIFYNKNSEGTLFDMGMSFMEDKKIKVVENVEYGEGKSFPKMLNEWEKNKI